jgi:hypothetical protein
MGHPIVSIISIIPIISINHVRDEWRLIDEREQKESAFIP